MTGVQSLLFRSLRPGDSDGGYAVADYRSVRPDLGDMDDLAHLTGELRKQNMSLVIDLVLNHVAAEHEWARRARAGEQRYRDYFFVYPNRTLTAPILFVIASIFSFSNNLALSTSSKNLGFRPSLPLPKIFSRAFTIASA